MKSPFENISDSGAFAPMFDETVTASIRRNGTVMACQALKVCVLSDADSGVIGSESTDSTVEALTLIVSTGDWRFAERLQRGDIVKRSQKEFSIISVNRDEALGLTIKLRRK